MRRPNSRSTHSSARLWGREMKILLNNTRYLRINNLNASSRNLCYCGVQTK